MALGISPVLGSHDTLICHSARGEDPIWHAQMELRTAAEQPTSFSGSFFNDGATQYMEASTICTGGRCGEYSADRTHLGFVYSRPDPAALFRQDPQRPIPILIRAESLDAAMPAELARRELTGSVADFVRSLDLQTLTAPYRR